MVYDPADAGRAAAPHAWPSRSITHWRPPIDKLSDIKLSANCCSGGYPGEDASCTPP